jgi:Na+-driven multidrug efflux pump
VNDEVRLIIQSSIRYGLTNGLMLALVLWNFGKLSLHIMGISSSSPLLDPAFTYLKIRALAAPAVLFIAVAEGAFRGFTDATTPLLASLIAAIINIILDPLMMFTMKMGVGGAAFATVISQYTAAIFYGICLFKRKMLLFSSMKFWKHVPFQQMWTWNVTEVKHGHIESDSKRISRTITQANISMLTKQGSLLFAWAYATACATRLGHFHVAAHQVALSLWLFFVLIIDGAAISAQILMSKTYGPLIRSSHSPSLTSVQTKIDEHTIRRNVQTLCYFMTFVSIIQGLLSTGAILWFGNFAPHLFTTDANIQTHLMALIPHLAWQQVLISLVLVLESLVVGANQFGLLAFGTTISTIVAVKNIHDATDIVSIWSRGIVSLFLGRLLTSIVGILNINGAFKRWGKKEEVS